MSKLLSSGALSACELCPRRCGADRASGARGVCGATGALKIARAALHFWEEPPISGERGSGTVFFSACPLKCVSGARGVCGATGALKIARAALHFWEEPPISGERGSGTVFFSACPLKCVYCQNHVCGATGALKIARAALHFWEEPPISGERGSGTVFFSACPLKCVYCQNHEISTGGFGIEVPPERLGATGALKIARAALHFWEEPPISGERGSGTVFFSACPLKCVYCQNHEISTGGFGIEVPPERLAQIMLELQEQGAHNINLVTATHYAHLLPAAIGEARRRGLSEVPPERLAQIMLELQEQGAHNINLVTATHYAHLLPAAIGEARRRGLSVPIVYNTSGYERVEAVDELADLVPSSTTRAATSAWRPSTSSRTWWTCGSWISSTRARSSAGPSRMCPTTPTSRPARSGGCAPRSPSAAVSWLMARGS